LSPRSPFAPFDSLFLFAGLFCACEGTAYDVNASIEATTIVRVKWVMVNPAGPRMMALIDIALPDDDDG
jgi:hypothetical protein